VNVQPCGGPKLSDGTGHGYDEKAEAAVLEDSSELLPRRKLRPPTRQGYYDFQ
jgi:hypothetical protein